MINYDQIKQVNKEIKPFIIERWDKKKGKQVKKNYAEVHEKVKAFRKLYPEGFITTEIIESQSTLDIVTVKATVGYSDDIKDYILGTGIAREHRDKESQINSLAYVENAETSAVGRALSFMGIGCDNAIASAEELISQGAYLEQQREIEKKKIDKVKEKALIERCVADGVDIQGICELYKVKTIDDMNNKQYTNCIDNWDKITIKCKGKQDNTVVLSPATPDNKLPF